MPNRGGNWNNASSAGVFCLILSFPRSSSRSYRGIYLYSSSNNTVTGNTCIRGIGTPEDYTTGQYTILLSGTGNDYNLISSNNCMGKAVVISGGTGNTVFNNKWNESSDFEDLRADVVGHKADKASETKLGHIKVGQGLEIESDGTLSVNAGGGVPSGLIAMWSGEATSIPDGWALCDGQNGTPDLRNRFIVGAGDEYTAGATGGEATHTLAAGEMPAHSHDISVSGGSHSHGASSYSAGSHSHTGSTNIAGSHTHAIHAHSTVKLAVRGDDSALSEYGSETTDTSGSHSHTISINDAGSHSHTISVSSANHSHTASAGTTGEGRAHENRPPYYALAFIMKL